MIRRRDIGVVYKNLKNKNKKEEARMTVKSEKGDLDVQEPATAV